ncbi:MAG: DivIVA domain-containing protein [Proteobacteria bacterium]|nr:DivIVA domain-containing protein [Pseudomonadota bacterium]MBU4010960.1 DivIVA domain-containing protein [Pseudomonadota bacterium]MBU4037904.1 DivIVA domain-containing protein [Pseudomonadota bacterium]
MKLTPLDIFQRKFRICFRGFDVEEVDGFLEDIADAHQLLISENDHLKNETERLRQDIKEYINREETFKMALINSQNVIEQMKDNAQKSADLIIADAEVKAEIILNSANNKLIHLHDDISELKRQRIQMEAQISSILETYSKLLEMSREEQKVIDIEEAKIEPFKKSI